MSLKENIEMVKEELNSEEKFFESAVKAERFWGRYKTLIIGGVVAIIAVVVISAVNDAKQESDAMASNQALATLQKGPDTAAESELATLNPHLLNLWKFSTAIASSDLAMLQTLQSSDDTILSDLATYEIAAIESDAAKLQNYASSQRAIYKDLAVIESALLLMKEKQIDQARQKLSLISQESPLYKVAASLMHYGVK